MAVSAEQIREFNIRYHDAASDHYDSKWGIDYGSRGQGQVLGKMRKALGFEPQALGRSLEIGAGTGYFTLNLLRLGLVRDAVATDISPGMLTTLAESAERLRLPVETAVCDSEELPFEDESFDLVMGHAVLHHLPDLDASFAEFWRVLRPGGRVVFCGEPSRHGDRIAAWPKRAANSVAPVWRRLMGAAERRPDVDVIANEDSLEPLVDVHAFTPGELGGFARRAGFGEVRVRGEELAANWFGWVNRTWEGSAVPEDVPMLWRQYAYYGYMAFQALDRVLLEPRLPPAIFYNLLLAGRKPD